MNPAARRLIWLGTLSAVAVTAIGAATAAAVGVGGSDPGPAAGRPMNVTTVQVARRTLVDMDTVDGTVAFGDAAPVTSQAPGTVTWLPAVGTVVSRGEPLLRADDQPVVLMYGALPMYRKLTTGVKGADVQQLKQNLRALGYTGFTVNADFTAATAATVKRWQKALKRTETGSVDVADVIYATGQLRVAKQLVRVGAKAAADVLSATTVRRVVILEVSIAQQRIAKVHNAVTVVLPDGKDVAGEVSSVGADANAADGGPGNSGADSGPSESGSRSVAGGDAGQSTPVVVEIADQRALGSIDAATVKVRYVAQTRPNVLTVPVQALLALAEGGYGLEVHDGADRRVVAVTVGLFSGGLVEVSGDGIAEATTVVVAG